jgi:uncharacterized RDD family membrane protein YckC
MAYCTECGGEVTDDAEFCSDCGAPIGRPAAPPTGVGGEARFGVRRNAGRGAVDDDVGNVHVVGRRIVAVVADGVLVGVLSVIPITVVGDFPGVGPWLAVAVTGFLYFWLLEGYYSTTPGKYALGLEVVSTGGSHIDIGTSGVRNLFRFVDGLPTGYLLGFVVIAISERNQRIGDLLANTLVIRRER